MRENHCPAAAELAAYERGELDEAALDEVTAHLEGCATCEQTLQALDALEAQGDPVIAALRRTAQARRSPEDDPQATLWTGLAPRRSSEGTPRRIGAFEVLEEIGRGGMGVVYKAWQPALRRFVAIKMILSGRRASAEEAIQFRREAETVARLHHPNLVQIYEIGEHDGLPFIALEHVGGGSLEKRLGGQPQPMEASARLVARLAEAVHAAHLQGVVHRDLKPANILLAQDQPGHPGATGDDPASAPLDALTPKVADFGLAKLQDGAGGPTNSGVVAGTPSYMAPEQADRSLGAVGPAADVYALGAILYEMLAGKPPFRADSVAETMHQVLHHEPVSPSRLRPRVPRDLETICLKCLSKDPGRRYGAALELAEELGRFTRGEPILARRPSYTELAWRWCRRNPLPAALVVLVALSLTGGFAATSFWALQAAANAEESGRNERKAKAAKLQADEARDEARANLYYAEMHQVDQARHFNRPLTRMSALLASWQPGDKQLDHRGWEWYYLDAAGRQDLFRLEHADKVSAALWNPAGDRLATLDARGVLRVWNAGGHGQLLLRVHDRDAGRSLAWSRDGKQLATGGQDGSARLWDAATGALLRVLAGHACPVVTVGWSLDGTQFRTVGRTDAKLLVHDLGEAGGSTAVPLGAPFVSQASWSPDGSRLALAGTGGVRVVAEDGSALPFKIEQVLDSLCWSPDGKSLAVSRRDFSIGIVDADTGATKRVLRGHRHFAIGLCWSPDGRSLCSGGLDHAVRLWDIDEGRLLHTWLGHTDEVFAVAWSPRGDRVVSAGNDGEARVWIAARPAAPIAVALTSVSWSADSARVAATAQSGHLHVLDRLTQRKLGPPGGLVVLASRAAFSPKGDRIACACIDGFVRVVDGTGSRVLQFLKVSEGGLRAVAWSPDGAQLAVLTHDYKIQFWDVESEKLLAALDEAAPETSAVAWSPDGLHLAVAARGRVRVWRVADRRVAATLELTEGRVERLAWSPDGARLATGDTQGRVQVWNAATAALLRTMQGSRDFVRGLAWNPDGRRLASAGIGAGMQIWDAETGKQAYVDQVEGDLIDLAWSTDGLALAGASHTGGFLAVWDAAKGRHFHHAPHRLHPTQLAGHVRDLVEQGDFAGLEKLAADVRAHHQDSPAALRLCAGVLRHVAPLQQQAGREPEAADALRRARELCAAMLERDPDDFDAALLLADLLLEQSTRWRPLAPTRAVSASGADLAVQPDRSVLASGVNPDQDAYVLHAPTDLPRVAALRLETIPDPRLPAGGAGRHPATGNFRVAALRLAAIPAAQGAEIPVPLVAAVADFATLASDPASVLDDLPETHWHTFPRARSPHWLVVRADASSVLPAGATLQATLDFRVPRARQQALGRFRLSVSDDPLAYLASLLRTHHPVNSLDRTRLAAALLLGGEPARALRWLDRSPEHNDPLADGFVRALIHHDLGDADQARTHLETTLAKLRKQPRGELADELAVQASARLLKLEEPEARARVADAPGQP